MLQSYDEIFDKMRNLKGDGVLKKHSPVKEECFWSFFVLGTGIEPVRAFLPTGF